MVRTLVTILAAAALAVFALGAASCGDPDYSSDLCQKLDDCNALADGESVTDCSDSIRKSLDDMTSSKRGDCERQIADCLDKSSCDNFLSCNISDCYYED